MPRGLEFEEKVRRLKEFLSVERRMPGYVEMQQMFEYRSKNAVYGFLEKLVSAGLVVKGEGGKLAPTGALSGKLQVLGEVQAGFPSMAEELLLDTLSLDEYLIDHPEATFLLRVSGESMIEAGIMPGDMVLVERGATAKDGDIVVAEVDGAWTLKFLQHDKQGVVLMPANKKFPPIRPQVSLEIGGVVRSVIRKY